MEKPIALKHDRRLGLNGISLTRARLNKLSIEALRIVGEEMEKLMTRTSFLENAPFYWIILSFLYGLKYDSVPKYSGINKKYGDLDLSIEVDVRDIMKASLEDVVIIFKKATLISLIDAGKKYNLPISALENELEQIK